MDNEKLGFIKAFNFVSGLEPAITRSQFRVDAQSGKIKPFRRHGNPRGRMLFSKQDLTEYAKEIFSPIKKRTARAN